MRSLLLLFVWLSLTPGFALAASLNTICLNTELTLLAARASGRVGVCVSDGTNGVSINGGEQFALYNVVELPVAVAVLDAVDHGQIHLNDAITIQANDRGSNNQNLAMLDGANASEMPANDQRVKLWLETNYRWQDRSIEALHPKIDECAIACARSRTFTGLK